MPEPIESIDDYVERIVSTWPEISPAQRQRLEQLLSPYDREVRRGRSATD